MSSQDSAVDLLSEENGDENRTSTSSRKWTLDEDTKLGQAIKEFGSKNWKIVSKYVGTRSSIQCVHRWQRYLKPGLKKGIWTTEEDGKLLSLYQHWGKDGLYKNWGALSHHMEGRSSKQCRERYTYYLDPSVNRSDFTSEEDKMLIEIQSKVGNKWSEIASQMVGRTDAHVKGRFRLLQRSSKQKPKGKKVKASNKSTPTESGSAGQKQGRHQKISSKKNDRIPTTHLALHDLASTALNSNNNESRSGSDSNRDNESYTDTSNINNLIHAHMTMYPSSHLNIPQNNNQQFPSNLSHLPPNIQAQIINSRPMSNQAFQEPKI